MAIKLDDFVVDEATLLEVEVRPIYDGFEYEEEYQDTGRQDILHRYLKTPIEYEGKTIIAFCYSDRYKYGYENQTSKRVKLYLYYNE